MPGNPETVSFLRAREKSFQSRRGRPDGGRPQCVAARSRAPPSRCLAPAPRLAGALHAHARSRCSLALCHASPLRKHISPPGARTEHACEHSIIICVAQPHYIISLAASYYIARGSNCWQHIYRSIASCDALRAPAVRSSRPRRRLKTFFALRKSETVSGFGSRLLWIDPATILCARFRLPTFCFSNPQKVQVPIPIQNARPAQRASTPRQPSPYSRRLPRTLLRLKGLYSFEEPVFLLPPPRQR